MNFLQTMAEEIIVRPMTAGDYDQVFALWKSIHGMGIRGMDDTRQGITRFLQRNPGLSVVAQLPDGGIAGTILAGHDGRQACFYHVCVKEEYRKLGVAQMRVDAAVKAVKAESINRIYLIAFKRNKGGNRFWQSLGWQFRDERNYYELYLSDENDTVFNP